MLTACIATVVWVAINYLAVEALMGVSRGRRAARVAVLVGIVLSGAIIPWYLGDLAADLVRDGR